MKGVRHFVDVLGGTMGSKMTLCPQNVEHTFEAVKSLLENRYREINLNCVYEEGWELSHAKILYEQLKRLSEYVSKNKLERRLTSPSSRKAFFIPRTQRIYRTGAGAPGT